METIKEVTFKPSTSPFGNTAAWVVLEDQEDGSVSEGLLFVWDKDRINFDKIEFLGLTVLEVHHLRHTKHRQVRLAQEARRRQEHHQS